MAKSLVKLAEHAERMDEERIPKKTLVHYEKRRKKTGRSHMNGLVLSRNTPRRRKWKTATVDLFKRVVTILGLSFRSGQRM